MQRLEGNLAVMTGGSSGIARATPAKFAERAPRLQLLVAARRRSIRQFTRLATAYWLLGQTSGSRASWTLAAHSEGTKAAWTSSQPKRFRQVLPAEYSKLNKGEPQKMLKRIATLILSTGMCLVLAGRISLALQDQSQSQDKMSGDKMESHDKMSKDKDKMSKHKMDKEEKKDKMDHQSN